jgi:hypothetical protein
MFTLTWCVYKQLCTLQVLIHVQAARDHYDAAVEECAPNLEDVSAAFAAMFPSDIPRSARSRDLFHGGVAAGLAATAPCCELAFDVGGIADSRTVRVWLVREEVLQNFVLLAYGVRCISGHGKAAKTMRGSIGRVKRLTAADIAPIPNVSTEADVAQVCDEFNTWLEEIRRKQEKFVPSLKDVINVARVFMVYGVVVTFAACHAVHKILPPEAWMAVCTDAQPTPVGERRSQLWLFADEVENNDDEEEEEGGGAIDLFDD